MRDEIIELRDRKRYVFSDLIRIIEVLRAPDGCPWDREQTHVSLKRNLIEEAYEVLEAIDKYDDGMILEELGDVLLQVVFHANIAETFGIDDVISTVCKKLIARHPHVFGEVTAKTSDAVLQNWEQIKRKEKGQESHTPVLKGVPANLPALMRAFKVQQKARDAGRIFDFADAGHALNKVAEELDELRDAMGIGSDIGCGNNDAGGGNLDEELGDLLFSIVNLARLTGVHPELALTASTEKFIRRFDALEGLAEGNGKKLEDLTQADADAMWNQIKKAEQHTGND
jgi:tetrapyrrole methylase family protein/MazG family protein